LELNGNVLVRIPIPKGIEKANARNDELSNLVAARIAASTNLRHAKADGSRNTIVRQIDQLEKQIDELVFQMFGFTAEDIQAVRLETATGSVSETIAAAA
jgi:hypothetical protein